MKAPARELEALCFSRLSTPPQEKAQERGSVKIPVEAATAPISPVEVLAPQAEPRGKTVGKKSALAPFPALPVLEGDANAQPRLGVLSAQVQACALCPKLVETRTHVVFGEGAAEAELMLVGEAPGFDEDRDGHPFAGEAGILLEKMLVAMGLSLGEVYLTTALKCRPDVPMGDTGSRSPSAEELERCSPYLAAQIAIVKPKVIVALGAGAMRALFGSTETAGKLRSHWHELHGIPVMPTFHPAYLVRSQSNVEKRKAWEDLLQVLERLNRPVSDKQRGYFKSRREA